MRNSFKYAFRGLLGCIMRERNMRIHLAFAFYTLIGCAITRAARWEWAACLVCAGAVMAAEAFNTAAEKLCDLLHPGRSEAIGYVKDLAAGAVLIMAAASAAVGCIVFISREKLEAALRFARENKPVTAALLLTLPLTVYLIGGRYGNDRKNSHDNASGQAERGQIDSDKQTDRGEGGDSHQ